MSAPSTTRPSGPTVDPNSVDEADPSAVAVETNNNINNSKTHIEESIDKLDSISKSGTIALKDRCSSPESDTSSLSEVTSSLGSDSGLGDKDLPDVVTGADADTKEPADKSASMSFDQKISAAVAYVTQAKAQFTPSKAAGNKHRTTPPASNTKWKKPRPVTNSDRCAQAALEVQKLPYQSIISLAMPPRHGLIPGQRAPEPEPANLPFGDTENYHNSMIIHYMDECEMTYTKAAVVYSEKFPHDAVTDEAVRKRHIRSLLRLKTKFGCVDPYMIPTPGKAVIRRGTPRAKKVSLIVPIDAAAPVIGSPAHASASTSTSTSTPHAVVTDKKRKISPRLFEKALIVTWHDDAKLAWNQIQNKLEDEYLWSISVNTIKKYYYSTLERVHGMGGKKDVHFESREDESCDDFEERVVKRHRSV